MRSLLFHCAYLVAYGRKTDDEREKIYINFIIEVSEPLDIVFKTV